jgi:uncharacterized protein (TIGR03067 family)
LKLRPASILASLLLLFPSTLVSDDQAAKDLEKLQGTWLLASAEEGGQDQTDDTAKKLSIIVKGDILSFKHEGQPKTLDMKITLDPSKNPKTIDLLSTARKVEAAPGIYSVEGDNFKLCWGKIGMERPTDFSTKPGDQRILLRLKRQKTENK